MPTNIEHDVRRLTAALEGIISDPGDFASWYVHNSRYPMSPTGHDAVATEVEIVLDDTPDGYDPIYEISRSRSASGSPETYQLSRPAQPTEGTSHG